MNRLSSWLRSIAWLPVSALTLSLVGVGVSFFEGNFVLSIGVLALVCAVLSFRE